MSQEAWHDVNIIKPCCMHVSDSPDINYLKRPPSSGKEDKKIKGLGSPDKMNQGFPREMGAKAQLLGHLKREGGCQRGRQQNQKEQRDHLGSFGEEVRTLERNWPSPKLSLRGCCTSWGHKASNKQCPGLDSRPENVPLPASTAAVHSAQGQKPETPLILLGAGHETRNSL